MNPELLLKHFNRISASPNAIPRLRSFILDLAVRGKLVSQDSKDEPAAELLKRNQAAKIQRGRVERPRKETAISKDGQNFLLPIGWVWASLADLVTVLNGRAYSQNELLSEGTPVLRVGNLFTSQHWYYSNLKLDEDKYCDEGDLIFAWSASFGPFIWRGPKVIYHYHIWKLALHSERDICKLYLYRLLLQKTQEIKESGHGISMLHMTKEKMEKLQVPLPPLAEQQRIVAKVAELMALCDRLEATQREREIRRDRLTAASIQHLNNGESAGIFRERVNFCLNNLAGLTSRPDQIKQIRQTVLNLAVRGQLVSQDPNDEPAHQLLRRIKAEKARLLTEGLIKKLDSAELPTASEFPFAMPPGWASSTLQSLCISVTDGDHLPPPKADQGVPFLVIGNVRSQTLNFAGCRHVPEQYYEALDAIRRPQKEDILYTLVGSYGIPVIVADNRPFCVQRHIGILRPSTIINVPFLSRVLESKWVFDQATSYATGIAQKTVPLAGLRRILIPLPPLAEQQRIVAKVDELMAVCDRLEAQLAIIGSESCQLLEALLQDALSESSETLETNGSERQVPQNDTFREVLKLSPR
jgi:type I restriction enzyme S subunit